MKVLKFLLAFLTTLAAACTALLLFREDKKEQSYIHIYGDED
jgi:hypothetical protein